MILNDHEQPIIRQLGGILILQSILLFILEIKILRKQLPLDLLIICSVVLIIWSIASFWFSSIDAGISTLLLSGGLLLLLSSLSLKHRELI